MSDVVASIKPLIFASQLTGFTIYDINDTDKWKAKYSKRNIPGTIFSVAVNLFVHYIYWNSYFGVMFEMQETQVARITIPNLISFTIAKILLFIKRHPTVKMLKAFQCIDDKFQRINLKLNSKQQEKKLILSLLASVTCVFAMTIGAIICVEVYEVQMQPLTHFLQFWAFIVSIILSHHLIAGMVGIRHRFELLNLFLKQNPPLMSCHVLKNLAEIHFDICKVIKIYNGIYGMVILSISTITFGWFCLFIFAIATGDLIMFTQYLFLSILDFVIYITIIGTSVSLVYFAERLKSQGMSTTKYLYKRLHKIEDIKQREVINTFINQIRDSQLEISSGFFNLNWSFVFKFVTAGVMYLVILLEFEASFKKDEKNVLKTNTTSNINE